MNGSTAVVVKGNTSSLSVGSVADIPIDFHMLKSTVGNADFRCLCFDVFG